MTRSSRNRKKTTPFQNLIVGLIVLILLYQFWQTISQENQESFDETAPPVMVVSPSVEEMQEMAAKPDEAVTSAVFPGGDFDYFVMALSWSPDYCATDGQNDGQQCAIGRQLGFVLHGLWPQYDQGYPSFCTNESFDSQMKNEFRGLFPNDNLFSHEWEKHGTCSGLTQEQYFVFSKQLKESVIIPDPFKKPQTAFRSTSTEIQKAFSASNPQYSSSSVAVYCSSNGRYLKEIFVCFAKDGQPMDCSSDVLKKAAKSCQSADFIVRNIR